MTRPTDPRGPVEERYERGSSALQPHRGPDQPRLEDADAPLSSAQLAAQSFARPLGGFQPATVLGQLDEPPRGSKLPAPGCTPPCSSDPHADEAVVGLTVLLEV